MNTTREVYRSQLAIVTGGIVRVGAACLSFCRSHLLLLSLSELRKNSFTVCCFPSRLGTHSGPREFSGRKHLTTQNVTTHNKRTTQEVSITNAAHNGTSIRFVYYVSTHDVISPKKLSPTLCMSTVCSHTLLD